MSLIWIETVSSNDKLVRCSKPISFFKIGIVVRAKGQFALSNGEIPEHEPKIGHVIGFGRNVLNELLMMVRWDNGQEFTVHPGNLFFMVD